MTGRKMQKTTYPVPADSSAESLVRPWFARASRPPKRENDCRESSSWVTSKIDRRLVIEIPQRDEEGRLTVATLAMTNDEINTFVSAITSLAVWTDEPYDDDAAGTEPTA